MKDRRGIRGVSEIFSIVLAMRRAIGRSHDDFCYALSVFSKHDVLPLPAFSRIERQDWTIEEKNHVIECIIKGIRSVDETKLPRLRLFAKSKLRMLLKFVAEMGGNESSLYRMSCSQCAGQLRMILLHLIARWGCSHVGFCLADICYSPNSTVPKMSTRCFIIYSALQYLEQEALSCDSFFREWGSDILVSFFFFANTSTGRTREFCLQAARRIAQHWLRTHSGVIISHKCREDILFFNEALFALQRLNMSEAGLEEHILRIAPEWHVYDYAGFRPENNSCITSYDQLNSLMIWSFFFRGTGARVDGISKHEVHAKCLTAVDALEQMVSCSRIF